jgi:hypothetical protein
LPATGDKSAGVSRSPNRRVSIRYHHAESEFGAPIRRKGK